MHHKLSFKLTCENQVIGLEDLNIKGMVKNHKLERVCGQSICPQISRAKAISDAGWGQFVAMLE